MVNKNGSKLAFNLKLSIRLPFNNAIKALCMPQPGQSKPIKLFVEQVNKCCSKKLISVSNF
jgi:hypothetical protein